MIEIEKAAETLTSADGAVSPEWRWRTFQELVAESLMVSLAVVVFDVLVNEKM